MSELWTGGVAPELASEFPGLRLRLAAIDAAPGPSPRSLRRRLALLSDRVRGASVVSMRARPVERAYRTFYRQIGLDPDVRRIPSEAVAVRRLLAGGFESEDLLADTRLVALVETGVPVWALDPASLAESPERDGGLELSAESGCLVVAAGETVVSTLFDEPMPAHAVGPGTRRVLLYALGVEGVPEIHLEEALWVCLELLGARG